MNSRTKKTIKNISFGLLSQVIITILAFITRTVFIKYLNNDYLGLNGLFSDILILLSLTELGFGTAIIYSMYKPMAYNDKNKINILLKFYKKVYNFIGILIIFLGLLLMPFLNYLISDIPNIPYINIIFILYVLNTSFSYFLGYKKSILVVDQRLYIFSFIQFLISILQNILQIIIIVCTKNYILYLLIMMFSTFLLNLVISIYVDKKYPYIKTKTKEKLSKEEFNIIKTNIKNMFVSKLSSTIVTSTDNLLISKFVSTVLLGFYSNYLIFVNLIKQLTSKIFEAVTGSVGNLVSVESDEKAYHIYMKMSFLNNWLSGLFCFCFYFCINDFVRIWIGDKYILSSLIVLLISINLYMRLIRNVSLVFIDTYGLFKEIKIKSIVESILNIIISLLLIKMKFGILGILLGTFISNLLTNFWFEPYLLFKIKFKKNLIEYYKLIIKNFLSIGICFILCYVSINFIDLDNNIINLIRDVFLSFFIFNIYYLLFFKKEIIYWKNKILERR